MEKHSITPGKETEAVCGSPESRTSAGFTREMCTQAMIPSILSESLAAPGRDPSARVPETVPMEIDPITSLEAVKGLWHPRSI